MPDTIISVEQLGKKYRIAHQAERVPYKTLRDTIAVKARHAFGGWRSRNGAVGSGNTTREEFWALKDVSFEVKEAEVLGIIGRNGAGKSTLLKILSRITEPSRGRVRIRGRVASLLEVGTGFHSELTGRENIYLNGSILGMTKAEIRRKFDEIVAFSEVEKFLDFTAREALQQRNVRAPGIRSGGAPRTGNPDRRRSVGRGRRAVSEEMPWKDARCQSKWSNCTLC